MVLPGEPLSAQAVKMSGAVRAACFLQRESGPLPVNGRGVFVKCPLLNLHSPGPQQACRHDSSVSQGPYRPAHPYQVGHVAQQPKTATVLSMIEKRSPSIALPLRQATNDDSLNHQVHWTTVKQLHNFQRSGLAQLPTTPLCHLLAVRSVHGKD